MKIGGVDPAVIRELSGIYKPFVKAVKELLSNAYDADADNVHIKLSPDFNSLSIKDDGIGMTPIAFHRDFTKVGGSYTRYLRGENTPKGRPKIGSKGIGFLAPARYCKKMKVVSSTISCYQETISMPVSKKTNIQELIKVPLLPEIIKSRFRVKRITSAKSSKAISGKRYKIDDDGFLVISKISNLSKNIHLQLEYELDCHDLEIIATIDFDYLLSLENRQDLEEITDFCEMQVVALPDKDSRCKKSYTHISLIGLKEFVKQDLQSSRRSGFVRNIVSSDGLSRFVWELSRYIPVQYEKATAINKHFGTALLHHPDIKFINEVTFTGGHFTGYHSIKRPIWNSKSGKNLILNDDLCLKVEINEDGLVAKGYIVGLEETVYPAEYRGIAIRVRNVQIGPPSFLGQENILTGFAKGCLSQITGEINILSGMDALDAINPGRESFYEENPHYKMLRRILVGDDETAGGLLEKIIEALQKRSRVASAIRNVINRAGERRGIIENISSGVLHYATSTEHSESLVNLFTNIELSSNGLSQAKDIDLNPTYRIGGYLIEEGEAEEGYTIDFDSQKIYLDTSHSTWSWRVKILRDYYEIINKEGGETLPICEIDTLEKRIYVNWNHPIRSQMDEKSFLKSAITWKIALHASEGDGERMLNLGLGLLSYKE